MGLFDKFKKKEEEQPIYSEKIEISGDWMTMFWNRRPIEVYTRPDSVVTFFNQNNLPYLWPDDIRYRNDVNSRDNPQNYLRLQWIIAYLHHPQPGVIIKTLQTNIPPDILETAGMTDALADLLVHPDIKVCNEAAEVSWRRSDASLKSLFRILSSQGLVASGISSEEGERAVRILRDFCPSERMQLFEQLALDSFGPTIAGLKRELVPGTISFKEKFIKPGALGEDCTYEVYAGENKLDALAFLEKKEIKEKDYFIVVETPQGNWGKDRKGIYKENA
jgi:hypothetical protein